MARRSPVRASASTTAGTRSRQYMTCGTSGARPRACRPDRRWRCARPAARTWDSIQARFCAQIRSIRDSLLEWFVVGLAKCREKTNRVDDRDEDHRPERRVGRDPQRYREKCGAETNPIEACDVPFATFQGGKVDGETKDGGHSGDPGARACAVSNLSGVSDRGQQRPDEPGIGVRFGEPSGDVSEIGHVAREPDRGGENAESLARGVVEQRNQFTT